MLVGLIVACEVLFWVFLLSGLAVRYLLRSQRLGGLLLFCSPVADLVLLVAATADLARGGTAGGPHVLAAVYLGVTAAYGHRMVRWADVRFAHRFAGGPAPEPKPRWGREHAAHERAAFLRHLSAWAIGCALMMLGILVAGDTWTLASPWASDRPGSERTEALFGGIGLWTLVLAIDGAVSLSYTVRPRPQPRRQRQLSR